MRLVGDFDVEYRESNYRLKLRELTNSPTSKAKEVSRYRSTDVFISGLIYVSVFDKRFKISLIDELEIDGFFKIAENLFGYYIVL